MNGGGLSRTTATFILRQGSTAVAAHEDERFWGLPSTGTSLSPSTGFYPKRAHEGDRFGGWQLEREKSKGGNMPFWVYILRCSDDSYYTGHTDDLKKRIAQHHEGEIPTCYTLKRRPLECVFQQEFPTREEALASERQIKGWSRKKKEAMVRGNWEEVSRLACSSGRSSLE